MKIEQLVQELEEKKNKLEQELEELKNKGMTFTQKYWYLPYCVIGFFIPFILLWAFFQ